MPGCRWEGAKKRCRLGFPPPAGGVPFKRTRRNLSNEPSFVGFQPIFEEIRASKERRTRQGKRARIQDPKTLGRTRASRRLHGPNQAGIHRSKPCKTECSTTSIGTATSGKALPRLHGSRSDTPSLPMKKKWRWGGWTCRNPIHKPHVHRTLLNPKLNYSTDRHVQTSVGAASQSRPPSLREDRLQYIKKGSSLEGRWIVWDRRKRAKESTTGPQSHPVLAPSSRTNSPRRQTRRSKTNRKDDYVHRKHFKRDNQPGFVLLTFEGGVAKRE
eukprot:scaffold110_cov315-Pavlova_lutheri.AAC.27